MTRLLRCMVSRMYLLVLDGEGSESLLSGEASQICYSKDFKGYLVGHGQSRCFPLFLSFVSHSDFLFCHG